MNIEELREFCLSLEHTEEKLPFDDNTLVFTVKNKIFCLTQIDSFKRINLKCEPEKAILLREENTWVEPGFHMNKKHWNSIIINNETDFVKTKQWIKDSYFLVISKLAKKDRF